LIPISEAAIRLGVSIDTLRRWDKSGKLRAKKSAGGHRYYSEKDINLFLEELSEMAYEWAANSVAVELPSMFYCQDGSIFQARLIKMQDAISQTESFNRILSLLVAIAGEIGNNSFDHNIGNWPDMPGIFFGYDINKKEIVLADRGLGVLKTLKRVKPKLDNHQDALNIAFTEMISGRSPEDRGNGLKFVRKIVAENPISLLFQSGDAELEIDKETSKLNLKKSKRFIRGCIAIIKF